MKNQINFVRVTRNTLYTLAVTATIFLNDNAALADSQATLQAGSQAAFESGSQATQNSTSSSVTQNSSQGSNEPSSSGATQNTSQATVETGRLLPPDFANRSNSAPTVSAENYAASGSDNVEAVQQLQPRTTNIPNVVNYHWSVKPKVR